MPLRGGASPLPCLALMKILKIRRWPNLRNAIWHNIANCFIILRRGDAPPLPSLALIKFKKIEKTLTSEMLYCLILRIYFTGREAQLRAIR